VGPVLAMNGREEQCVPGFPDVAFEMMLESGLNVRGYGDGPDAGVRFRPTDDLEPSLSMRTTARRMWIAPASKSTSLRRSSNTSPKRRAHHAASRTAAFRLSWVSSTKLSTRAPSQDRTLARSAEPASLDDGARSGPPHSTN